MNTDVKQEMPEYVETLESQLNRARANILGMVQWEKMRDGTFTVQLLPEVLQDAIIDLAKGSHTGIWLKDLIAGVFPHATPVMDANEHLGIRHPERACIGTPAIIVNSLHNYIEHGQATGSFLRSCLENDFIGAGGRADPINGTALPEIAKYIFNELPPDSFGTVAKVADWLELTDDDRKEYLKNWRESNTDNS